MGRYNWVCLLHGSPMEAFGDGEVETVKGQRLYMTDVVSKTCKTMNSILLDKYMNFGIPPHGKKSSLSVAQLVSEQRRAFDCS